jgi:hypothetical protein
MPWLRSRVPLRWFHFRRCVCYCCNLQKKKKKKKLYHEETISQMRAEGPIPKAKPHHGFLRASARITSQGSEGSGNHWLAL